MPATLAQARAYVFSRETAHKSILLGKLPTVDELLEGHVFARDDLYFDCLNWVADTISHLREYATEQAFSAALPVLENLLRKPEPAGLQAAVEVFARYKLLDEALRCLLYMCCMRKQYAARQRVVANISTRLGSVIGQRALYMHAVALGLSLSRTDLTSMEDYSNFGLNRLRGLGEEFAVWKKASENPHEPEVDAGDPDPDADFLQAVAEDRAEFFVGRPAVGMVVVPSLPEPSKCGGRKDVVRSWDGLAGKRLRIVTRGDLPAQRAQLVSRWPHAAEVIDTVLRDLSADDRIRFRPTVFVGEPGSGKSSLARAIAEAVGLPTELVPLAGLADGSIAGTSAQWSTARESVPLQLVKSSRIANPCVVWDEVEKAVDSQNGSATNALLPMLEPSTSRRIRDLALEVEVDLSMVSHFATANSLEGIPSPLRDRMRILAMPDPSWEHVGVLVKGILDDIAKERRLDRRWLDDLAEDEMELLHSEWTGGSIRQLRRIVEVLIDGREMVWGRA